MKYLSFVILILSLMMTVAGQTAEPKPVNGGVLNGKAIYLPAPAYPPAARAVKAKGTVGVNVVFDTDGSVRTAQAVSGHPLLRPASVEAAKKARFRPVLIGGKPVSVYGVINYVFRLEQQPASYINLGFNLGFAANKGKFFFDTSPDRIAMNMPTGFDTERKVLNMLGESLASELLERLDNVEAYKNDQAASSQIVPPHYGDSLWEPNMSDDQKAEVQSVIENIEKILPMESPDKWRFKIGLLLGAMSARIEDDVFLTDAASKLAEMRSSAPSGMPENLGSRLESIFEIAQDQSRSVKSRSEMNALLMPFRKL